MADILGTLNNGVGGIASFLDAFTTQAKAQAAADEKLKEETVRQHENLSASAAEYNLAAQQTLESYRDIEAKRQEAQQLASSSSIFDRITLMGEQILNPRDYTREGREKRVGELTQGLALAGQVHNAQVVLTNSKIAEAEALHGLETLGANQATLAIKAQVEGLQKAQAGLMAMEEIKRIGLNQLDATTIQKALIGPVPPSGKITVGGIDFTPTELREQAKTLETRERLSFLSPIATDPEYAQKLNVQHEMILATMDTTKLTELRNNGFIMPETGQQVSPATWQMAWDRALKNEQTDMELKLNQFALENQVPKIIEESQQFLNNTKQYASPGTPLNAARLQFETELGGIALIAQQDQTPQGKIRQMQTLQLAREKYIQALQKEAKIRSAGDEALGNIYLKQMTGQFVSSDEIADVLRTRYVKHNGFGTVLPTEDLTKLRGQADKFLQEKRLAASQNIMGDKVPEAELREQAFNEAFNSLRESKGAEKVNQALRELDIREDHPGRKVGLPPSKFSQVRLQADANTKAETMRQYGLTQEQMHYLLNEDNVSAGLPAAKASEIMQGYNQRLAAEEYNLYEVIRPGLGNEVMSWYQQTLPAMADKMQETLDPMIRDYVGDSVRQQLLVQSTLYGQANQAAIQRTQEMVKQAAFRVKEPANYWMMLLNSSTQLEDPEKQAVFYGVIQPTVAQAKQLNYSPEQTQDAIMSAIDQYQGTDSITNKAIKQLQRELPTLMKNNESIIDTLMALTSYEYASQMNSPFSMTQAMSGVSPESTPAQSEVLRQYVPWLK